MLVGPFPTNEQLPQGRRIATKLERELNISLSRCFTLVQVLQQELNGIWQPEDYCHQRPAQFQSGVPAGGPCEAEVQSMPTTKIGIMNKTKVRRKSEMEVRPNLKTEV